ncbi:MAG: SpoIIIAH-like family protein [Clostridium sp.]|uniref:SpoIIIAH-like family protein n=1 Tax=Clostridium sp. TaxID=1506 RepID=UPI00290F2193|nr:SpoIIIAH-like family protein [Clostridium sp.]MDU5110152.1 SpoIIIAH-like family protein [Clostridium sp.]
MTKKQFGIIFTLMALIVCVGVIAAKINKTGLNDPTDFSQVISQQGTEEDKDKDKDKETLGSQDYFFSLRSEKEKEDAITLQNLDALIADANTSQEAKDLATNNRLEKTTLMDKESRIEVGIKNKGYEDVLCSIDGSKVRIVIKADELDDAATASIQEIAENVSGISDIIIDPKK